MERRDFLKGMAAAGVLAAQNFPLVGQENSGRKLGWALVGLGSLSKNQIAPALQKTKHAGLAAIVTGTPGKAEEWSARYNLDKKNVYSYETFDRIADNPEVDVVYIVLPNAMHGEYTIRAAKAGKHVFCEKPMEVSVEKCEAMIAACKQAKKLLGVAYRCQFVPHHLEMIRLARQKEFGDLKLIEASFGFKIGDPKQWRLRRELAGGGALMDVGVYALQAARYISGEEPTEIYASESKTDRQKFAEVDESIIWSMRFPSGLLANCATTYNANGYNRVMAAADEGWFGLEPAYSYSGIKGKTSKGQINLPEVDHFAAEMDDFSKCILDNKPTRVPGEEGLRDVRYMTAIYESIAKKKPIQLA